MVKGRAYIGDDGDKEWLCKHGVGHGFGVHTCDGEKCCKEAISHLAPKRAKTETKNVRANTQKCTKEYISISNYQKKMDRILNLGMTASETLIAMIEEAGKYELITQTALRKRDKVSQKQPIICDKKGSHGFRKSR